jgi:6-phosphogluconolactonase (cycloisomerase 2 family)
MTKRRAPILHWLARGLSAAAVLASLVQAPGAGADSAALELKDDPIYGYLASVLDSKDPAPAGAPLAWLLTFFYPISNPSAPPGWPTAKSAPDYGSMTPVPPLASADHCIGSTGVALDPSGKFVFMNGGIGLPGRMCGFVIDPVTRAWTPVTPLGATPAAVGSNPRAVAIEPSGRFVYVAGDLNGTVSGFAVDRVTGVPTPLPGSPFATSGFLPIPMVIDRSGRFIYVGQSVGSFGGSIAVFAVDAATGALAHIPGSPFPNVADGGGIAALALSPDGRFLFTGGSSLATYAVNPVTGGPTRIASRAGYFYGLAVDPTGRFLFGVDDTDGRLHGFSIAANGALTSAGAPQSIGTVTRATSAIVSVGDLVYVGNFGAGGVYGFRIHPNTGALTPVAGSPFASPPRLSAFAASANLPPSIQVDAGDNVVASVGVSGGRPPYTWSIVSGALPPGAALSATTGVFLGVISAAGTYSFTVQVADSLGATATAAKSIAVAGGAIPTPVSVVEFYSASLDHYFITWVADEIAKLDNGTFKGWVRTGLSFNAWATAQSGTSAVCRIYIPPGKGDGHFFGRDANECDGTMTRNPTFVLESSTFFYLYPPTLGNCAVGQVPVYRVFSNRADANHRYTTSRAVRDQMVAKGWLAEGDGADTVVMCAPA